MCISYYGSEVDHTRILLFAGISCSAAKKRFPSREASFSKSEISRTPQSGLFNFRYLSNSTLLSSKTGEVTKDIKRVQSNLSKPTKSSVLKRHSSVCSGDLNPNRGKMLLETLRIRV